VSKAVDKMHGSHHWTFERALSVASLGLIASAFALHPNKLIDFGLGLVLPLHSHLGFSAIITDYLPKRKFGRVYPVAMGVLYGMTGVALYGLYEVNTKGPGICEAVATVWTAKRSKSKSLESD
jgi:succinate dehydrogenase (ubiquinone) membrane anchor subunit